MQLELNKKHRKKTAGTRHPLLRKGDSLGLPQRKQGFSKGHRGGKGGGRRRPFSEVKTARGEQQAQLERGLQEGYLLEEGIFGI